MEKIKPADAVYLPAFDRIFLLLKHFYSSGLRGDILEFGVFLGYSARVLAANIKRYKFNSTRLHLFDSFEGFPEAVEKDLSIYEVINGIWQRGGLSTPKEIELLIEKGLQKELGKERVSVTKGFFNQTLEETIRKGALSKALLVHLDCDLYSSSKYVLHTLFEHGLIQDGTIVICDDWMTSLGNPNLGQRKAVAEILLENPQWQFEPYLNYGLGSQVFVAHDLSVSCGKKFSDSEREVCPGGI